MKNLTLLLVFLGIGFSSFAQEYHLKQINSIDTCYEKEYAYENADNQEVIEIELSIDSIRLGEEMYILNFDSSFSLGSQPKTLQINSLLYIRFRKAIIIDEGIPVNHIRYSVYKKKEYKCWEHLVSSNYNAFGSSGELGQVTTRIGEGLSNFEGYYWTILRVD